MRLLAVPVALVAMIAAAGCGPSLRRVYRGAVYFERCYAADLDPAVPIEERRACWQQWMTYYQQGQGPDRIDYVRERLLRLDPERAAIVALATGGVETDPVPVTETAPAIAAEAGLVRAAVAGTEPPPGHEVAVPSAEASDVGTTPDPEAHASPAPVEVALEVPLQVESAPAPERRRIAPARERRLLRPPILPRSETPHCTASCQPRWDACTARCDQGNRSACLQACRLELRACSRGCY